MERCDPELPEGDSAMHLRMTWRGHHPTVKRLHGEYPDGVRFPPKK